MLIGNVDFYMNFFQVCIWTTANLNKLYKSFWIFR